MVTRTKKEDDRFVMSRSEDHSIWAAFDYYTTKYKVLIWATGILVIALGFDWKTPRAIFHDLQAQIVTNKVQVDSIILPKIDATNKRIDGVETKVDIQLLNMCFDKSITVERAALTGLTTFCQTHNVQGKR